MAVKVLCPGEGEGVCASLENVISNDLSLASIGHGPREEAYAHIIMQTSHTHTTSILSLVQCIKGERDGIQLLFLSAPSAPPIDM